MTSSNAVQAAREGLQIEVRRVADRLRTLAGPRIEPHLPALRDAAQVLIDCSINCAGSGDRPERARIAPDPDSHAWGDVVAVLGQDVLADCVDCDPAVALGQLRSAERALGQLRRSL